MPQQQVEVTVIETLDSAFVFDHEENEWQRAWLSDVYKRVKKITKSYKSQTEEGDMYTDSFFVEPFRKIIVFARIEDVVTGATATVRPYWSHNGATWYVYSGFAPDIALDESNPNIFRTIDVDGSYVRFSFWHGVGNPQLDIEIVLYLIT